MYPYYQQNQNLYPSNANSMNWCQGENGAKSFPVAPGNTVPIFDSEESCLYIKTVDVMGRPLPLKVLDYKERTNEPQPEYVGKNEMAEAVSGLNEKLDVMLELLSKKPEPKKKEDKDAK